jgi:hypothetical protein
MPEITPLEFPRKDPGMPPMSHEDILKKNEYEQGKKVQLRDGSIVIVKSAQEEMEIRKMETENN